MKRFERWIVLLAMAGLFPCVAGCEDQEKTRQAEALERTLRSQADSERTLRMQAEKQLEREQRRRRIEQNASEWKHQEEARKTAFGETLSITFGALAALAIFLLARERRLRSALLRAVRRILHTGGSQ